MGEQRGLRVVRRLVGWLRGRDAAVEAVVLHA
jgi:hypothetical protein